MLTEEPSAPQNAEKGGDPLRCVLGPGGSTLDIVVGQLLEQRQDFINLTQKFDGFEKSMASEKRKTQACL